VWRGLSALPRKKTRDSRELPSSAALTYRNDASLSYPVSRCRGFGD
jgi:hypothetical protein